jgi:hypothetical protein
VDDASGVLDPADRRQLGTCGCYQTLLTNPKMNDE